MNRKTNKNNEPNREKKIKSNHKKLKAGFFVDYDFENKKFYDGKQW